MNFINYNEFINDIKNFIETLPILEKVSYILKSGIISAFMYSKRYNVPLIELSNSNKNTIIFDDSVFKGRRLKEIQKNLNNSIYAVIYYAHDYKDNYILFVEDEIEQAIKISNTTKKPVLCIDTVQNN